MAPIKRILDISLPPKQSAFPWGARKTGKSTFLKERFPHSLVFDFLDTDLVAVYVDKILKGRTPADLPVEQPMKFDFVINLKAAKQIVVTVAPNMLVRAGRVIR